eukprot:SAG22_NODE_729_length_7596_cov_20.310924_2_plen_67_part_00
MHPGAQPCQWQSVLQLFLETAGGEREWLLGRAEFVGAGAGMIVRCRGQHRGVLTKILKLEWRENMT